MKSIVLNLMCRYLWFVIKGSQSRFYGLHLLLGIQHDGVDGNWKFLSHHIVDLSEIRVKLKAEFHTSNSTLYKDNLIIN